MRLNRLDLTRYGHFTDQSLTFPQPAPGQPDLHLIYGPNEAGKSTTLAAWLDLLFGIPTQSRNNFLHPYSALRIGAALDIDGSQVEVARVKRTSGSLIDRDDAPLPEALLQGALGGLTRDSYAAMFSLDDDTLEQGGDGILASKGDLGEMLFSASAGMADLSRKLETLRAEADGFYRPGGRKGPVHTAKTALSELDEKRRLLDVQATAHKALTQAEAEAKAAWETAQTRHRMLTQALHQTQQRQRLLPYQARLQQVQAELQPLAHLPPLPQGTADRLAHLQQALDAVAIRREETLLAQGRADRALAALTPDPAVLALAPRIAAAEALRAAHDEAVKDLPNRQTEADAQATAIAQALTQIGHPGADPRSLVLPAPTITALRRLIATRSGLATALTAATAEATRAQQTLTRLDQRLTEAGAPTADTAALGLLVARLKQRDPADALTLATRAATVAADDLAQRMAALAPWQGTPEALAAMAVPTARQIDTWTAEAETLRIAAADAARQIASLRAEIARAPTAPDPITPGLTAAAAARALRERVWADHRQSLTPTSAAAFETAMRQDDQITARLADLQADARLHAAQRDALTLAAQTLALAEQTRDQALRDQQAQDATVAQALAALQPLTLPDLRNWLDARAAALTALSQWHQAEQTRLTAAAALTDAARTLALALDTAPAPYDLLIATAQARIDADRALTDLRTQRRDAKSALAQRESVLTTAAEDQRLWHSTWQSLTAPTWLHDHHPDTVPPILASLDALDKAVTLQDSLLDRIAKMTANRDSFAAEHTAIAIALALDPVPRWDAITQRLRLAEQTEANLARESKDRAEALQKLADLAAEEDTARTALRQMAEAFATTPANLSAVVAGAAQAADLRRAVAVSTRDLAEAGGSADTPLPDRALLEAEATSLTAEAEQANATLQDAFARLTEAKRQVQAVGDDDSVARLDAQRANLLEDLAESARTHLARRLGILVLDKGLQRYRDSHRSAMLARASAAFATLTRGAYRSLAAQPGEAGREVLVAVARDGAAKLADALSKGTRFQLYLALRIAGYHELAKSRKPVPFLADDIMETFDNHRAAEAFTLLADMARTGQVIYLTHHAHLCDIAQSQCPGVTVHQIARIP